MIRLSLTAVTIILAITLALAGPLQAAPRYVYQDLGILPGGDSSGAFALNHAGQVAGTANLNPSGAGTHAFLKNPGQTMQDLGTMAGGHSSEAYGINDAGQVVGEGDHDGYTRAFLKTPGEIMQDLGHLGGGVSRARGINDAGVVVGWSDFNDGVDTGVRAFLKNPGENMQNLGTLGGWWSDADAINNAGQVAGTSLLPRDLEGHDYARAYLKNPGGNMQNLGILPGASSSFAFGLNNAGQVVGYVYDAHPYRAFLKTPGQDMQDLGTLGGNCSWAYGINDAGQVVGWSQDATTRYKAFLWEKGVMYNLNHLLVNPPGNGEWPGVYLDTARAINNRGWIVGYTGQGYSAPHAFLLIPVTGNAAVDLLLLN